MYSKLTIYDFLTQFIMGYLILFLFAPDYIITNNHLILFAFIWTLGMIYHRIIEIISNVAIRIFPRYLDIKVQSCAKRTRDKDCGNEYYKAYYTVFRSKSVDSVFVLEAHYCFIKNILPILFIYMILIWCNLPMFESLGDLKSLLNYLLPLMIVSLSFANIYIRYKIYELIFQAEYFLEQEKDHSADNSSK